MKCARISVAVLVFLLSFIGSVCADGFTPRDEASEQKYLSRGTKAGSVNLFGTIKNNLGQDICGLVLANGQFVFSCSPNGTYSLTVPLDSNNQVGLFGFAEGHFPFKIVLGSNASRYDIVLTMANSAPPSNPNRANSELLVGGTWTYTYTIVSTWTDQFMFTSVASTPDAHGDYLVTGIGPANRPAVGEYISAQRMWAVLWSGTIIDEFFTFTFSGNNNVSGCYYQISPPGSTNLSRCYAMAGFRSPPKALTMEMDERQRLLEVARDNDEPNPDVGVVDSYLLLKSRTAE